MKKQTFNEYVDNRLEQWATWVSSGISFNLGYPSTSSITMFQNGQRVGGGDYIPLPLPVAKESEEIEKYINQLSNFNTVVANVLKKNYLGNELSMDIKAKRLGISVASFKIYLQMGKMWIAGRLSACYLKQ